MPNPTVGDVRQDSALTNLAIAYLPDARTHFAREVFASVDVSKKSGKYGIFDRGDFLRNDAQRRAPGTPAARGGFNTSFGTYTAEEWAYEYVQPDEVRENWDLALDADRSGVAHVMEKLLIAQDAEFASTYLTTGVFDNDVVPGTKWDAAGSDPIGDMRTASRTVLQGVGHAANVACISQDAWDVLSDHADLLDRIKYTEKGIVTTDLLASVLGLEKVVVAAGVYDSAAEGQTESMAFHASECCLMVYASQTPSIDTPSAGYIFSWTQFDQVRQGAAGIRSYREEKIKSTVFGGCAYYDMAVTATGAGYFLNDLLT